MSLVPLGEGCKCVTKHSPSAYIPAKHHILPQSWGGQTVESNLITLCSNTHLATHRLIDEYVRAGGDPGWAVRRQYGSVAQTLAHQAWEQRPAHPTVTSLGWSHVSGPTGDDEPRGGH